jgi:hypothetical protein
MILKLCLSHFVLHFVIMWPCILAIAAAVRCVLSEIKPLKYFWGFCVSNIEIPRETMAFLERIAFALLSCYTVKTTYERILKPFLNC